jgi:hypothetical protein
MAFNIGNKDFYMSADPNPNPSDEHIQSPSNDVLRQ